MEKQNCNHKNSNGEYTIEVFTFKDNKIIKEFYVCSNPECQEDITELIIGGIK
jgi:hypothetical protein